MYLSSEKPRRIDFDEETRELMIDAGDSVSDELSVSISVAAATEIPKKRAETWVQDETQTLISLRHETDSLFNTSKSNKHLWDSISAKMADRGFDRSPTMCTDKWRNLLKEFKRAKHHHGRSSATEKMAYYKEIGDILGYRNKTSHHSPESAKLDSFIQFSDKGVVDDTISFEQLEATCQKDTLNLERCVDRDQTPPLWNSWRDTPGNCGGGDSQSYCGNGRFISVKWGDYTRRIGIEGTAESIKEAIKSAFRFRTRRAFWLEDEEQVVRSLDKNMPLGDYTLHIDEGLIIKVCLYDESEHMAMHAEEKIFYTEDDYRDFLTRQGWTCLREFDGYNVFCNMDDLRPGAIYRGAV